MTSTDIEREIAEYSRRKVNAANREYYHKHREAMIERSKKYYHEHKEARLAYKREWDNANRDKNRAYMRAYREKRKAEKAKQKSEEVIPCNTADQRRRSASSST